MHTRYLAYMSHLPNLVGIFVSEIYLAIKCEVVVVFCNIYAKMLGPYAHLACWLCVLYFGMWEPYLFSDVCVKYVYCAPC